MKTKLCVYDLETTGTDHWRHAIHQLSCMIVIDDVIVEKFDLKIRPHEQAHIEPEALKVGGVTLEEVQAYPHRTAQFAVFIEFLNRHIDPYNPEDKLFLLGFNNVAFDDRFLRNFFILEDSNAYGCYFFNNSLDASVLASQYLLPDRAKMPSFKLSRVAKHLGIAVDESRLHDSIYDCELTWAIYNKVKGKTIDDW